jgi:23S rRNA (uracil1939-C5)-methyltransferase
MPLIEIEKLVYGGDGLSRLEGQVILTPLVLPSERITVETSKIKNGLLRGVVTRIEQASPHRVDPRCPYFGSCGGCQYQHSDYGYQVEQKRNILLENLQRLGGISYSGEIETLTADPWFYRNRIQLHFAKASSGFHRLGSNQLVPVADCFIASPLLVEAIKKLSELVSKPEWPSFLQSAELFSNETDLQINVLETTRPVAARFFEWLKKFLPIAPGPIAYRAAGHEFRISHGAFFQVNRFLIEQLVEEVMGEAAGEHAIDLYAGVGLFSLPLAAKFAKVDSVERSGPAVRDLEFNAQQGEIRNVTASRAASEEFLRAVQIAPDLIVADPPRSGLGKEATEELIRIKPKKLTIVSCDPATLARDLKHLQTAFRITRMTLVDLFPQTYHLETVVHLEATRSVE